MPLFRVVPRLAYRDTNDAYKWSNVWYLNQPTVLEAAQGGQSLMARMLPALSENAYCYEIYASDLAEGTSVFVNFAPTVSLLGEWPVTGELYNAAIVYRFSLNVPSSRPSRKFWRVPFHEGDIDSLNIASGLTLALSNALDDVFDDIGSAIRDESDNLFTGYVLDGLTVKKLGRTARVDVPPNPFA